MSRVPQVVAFGGGGFSMESGNALLDDYVLAATGVERPKACFLPTPPGDADHPIGRFHRHLPAPRRGGPDPLPRRFLPPPPAPARRAGAVVAVPPRRRRARPLHPPPRAGP